MIDSGARNNLITESAADKLGAQKVHFVWNQALDIEGRQLSHTPDYAYKLTLISPSRTISHHYFRPMTMPFPIVLGMPWLYCENPDIDWRTGDVRARIAPSSVDYDLGDADDPDCHISAIIEDEEVEKFIFNPDAEDEAFRMGLIANDLPILAWLVDSDAGGPPPTEVPINIREFAEVFNRERSQKLPEYRGPPLDMEIHIQAGKTVKKAPIYNTSHHEHELMKSFLTDYSNINFIRPSKSPITSPVLFADKKGGGDRLCVDYRRLNAVTIKNNYPIPLVSVMLQQFKGARWFTKLDLVNGYHHLRIAKGFEYLTAFACRYGVFEWLVMPFGLCNAPAQFQEFINHVLGDLLDVIVVAYLDDIVIYTDGTEEEHWEAVRKVLANLEDHDVVANLKKSRFAQKRIDSLGFIVDSDGAHMDEKRVQAIVEWPKPKNLKELRVFLGFANFYRRWIEAYSRTTVPLTDMFKANAKFDWTEKAQNAFDNLKAAFTKAPLLCYFDHEKESLMHTDASGFAISAIFSQIQEDSHPHPVAFYSRKLSSAERNYTTHDAELLAIVEGAKHFRHWLLSSPKPVPVYTDHSNLRPFLLTKTLTRQQVRWSTLLAECNVEIRPVKGTRNPADGPSRRPDYVPKPNELTELSNSLAKLIVSSREEYDTENAATLASVQDVAQDNETANKVLEDTEAPDTNLIDEIRSALPADLASLVPDSDSEDYIITNGLLFYQDRIVIPDEAVDLHQRIIREFHDSPAAGHFGKHKTQSLLLRHFKWKTLRKDVEAYIAGCDTCKRIKPVYAKAHGQLTQLPVPAKPWDSVSMDFIVDLPLSGSVVDFLLYDCILVIVDRFTKMALFHPVRKDTTAEQFALIFIQLVFSNYGVPSTIVSDRDHLFTSAFWRYLSKRLTTDHRLSTAVHPRTNGQTERLNQILEIYLRAYCNFRQDNWRDLLGVAQFAYNNSVHSGSKTSPFYALYGRHPTPPQLSDLNIQTESDHNAERWATHMEEVRQFVQDNLIHAQNLAQKYGESDTTEFAEGDMVWLNGKNIKTQRPSKKLDHLWHGPFVITQKVGTQAYRLRLPADYHIHDVFHISLLRKDTTGATPADLGETNINRSSWEVAEILDSKYIRRKLNYRVRYLGRPQHDDAWVRPNAIPDGAELIKQFHERYPSRPGPDDTQYEFVQEGGTGIALP